MMADSGTGVLLLNMGGPEKKEDIALFLRSLLGDPMVFGAPWPVRPLLARMITSRRLEMVSEHYEAIGGKSPVIPETRAQAEALSLKMFRACPVNYAFTYSEPKPETAVLEMKAAGIRRIIALPLFPQWSKTTSGAVVRDVKKACTNQGLELAVTRSFPDEAGYIKAMAELTLPLVGEGAYVLYSAHGLPESVIRKGDPYVQEVESTVSALKESLPRGVQSSCAFQSRVGPVRWVRPFLDEEIRRVAQEGVKSIVTVPVSFVCENLETLYELDIEIAQLAAECGIESFKRTPAPGVHPAFIGMLEKLVIQTSEKAGWE